MGARRAASGDTMRKIAGTILLVIAIVLQALPVLGQGAGDDQTPAGRIKAALDRKDPVSAWKGVLELSRTDQQALAANTAVAQQAFNAIVAQTKLELDAGKPERAIEVADLLADPRTAELYKTLYPTSDSELLPGVIRQTNGQAHWQLGNRALSRGQRDSADAIFKKAIVEKYLQRGDEYYPRACSAIGTILMEKAEEAAKGQRFDEVKACYDQAARWFVEVRDQSGSDEAVRKAAVLALHRIASTGIQLEVPGLPTPTPAPTATPVPGFLDGIAGDGATERARVFFRNLGRNPATQRQMFFYLLLVFGLIIGFWVLPTYILKRMMLRGDMRAAELLPMVKYAGPFTFIFYLKGSFHLKPRETVEHIKQACPNCGFDLGDMLAYEDLVFSKCPKCKTKITPLFSVESYIQQIAASLATDVEKVNVGAISIEKYIAKDTVVRLVRAIITLGVRRRASDVHVEPDEEFLHVRQRIDGVMTEMFNLPRSLSLALVSALKVQGGMNIAEKRVPQDGKFQVRIDKTDIDVRAASSPTGTGEKVSLRILDVRSIQMETKHLGMSPQAQHLFESAIHQPHGMMLITGPTGSGKTTTIYVALQALRTGEKNIISIEDPIEFRIPGVNQIQVNPTAGLTFASGLRSILRQDPDVIVIGEIRDKETAEIAVNSSTTGHMVFSTLHTVDAASSVARLIDLGVSARQFVDALSLIVAQRLIRLVCQYCKQSTFPGDEVLRELGLNRVLVEGFDFQSGKGCQVCNNTGHYRRTGVFEMLTPSDRLRSALEQGSLSTGQIRDLAIQGGMRTLRQEAIALLQQGLTSAEETLRVTK